MQTLLGISSLPQLPPGAALSIGNFDGLHMGHRSLLNTAKSLAASAGVAVITFDPHPLTVLRPQSAPPLLTPLPLKQQMLADLGVDHLVILAPTPDVLNLTAQDFWLLLKNQVRPAHLIEGQAFTFGKNRAGSMALLRQWAADSSIQLHVIEPVLIPLLDQHLVPISSSLIRWLLLHGRARDAALALGAPFTLTGTVIHGHHRGRTIGIPTANLDVGPQLIPATGVYGGQCTHNGTTYPAAISIGDMPTFGQNAPQLEVHLLNFTGDLYGQTLQVQVTDWLRDQWKFPTIDALIQRINNDLSQIRHPTYKAADGVGDPLRR